MVGFVIKAPNLVER